MSSRPVIVLLSQLLTVPLHQPLLGHMVQQCQQKPPQSASAIETLGSLLLNHPPVFKLEHTTHPQRWVDFYCIYSSTNPPRNNCKLVWVMRTALASQKEENCQVTGRRWANCNPDWVFNGVCGCIHTLFQQLKLLRSKKCWCSWSTEASFSDRDSLADCCQPRVHRLRRKRLWWCSASWQGLERKVLMHADECIHTRSYVPGLTKRFYI